MRVLNFVEPGHVEWFEAPEPSIETPDDALVRPVVVALCDADTACLQGDWPAPPGPFPMGHEFVAEVVEIGERVRALSVGQLVCSPVQISCGQCARCRSALTASCQTVDQPAAWGLGAFGGNRPGAFADIVCVPFAEHMLVPIPEGVDPRHLASVGDNIADAWRTVAPQLGAAPGAEVLVVGRRSIGLFAVAIANALGASRVDYFDNDPERLSLAEKLGAQTMEGEIGKRVGSYPISVDASGTHLGLVTALRSTSPGGVCTCSFPGFENDELPLFEMWTRGINFNISVAHCRAAMPEVLELISSRRLQPELLISEFVGWDDAHQALRAPTLKPVVVRD